MLFTYVVSMLSYDKLITITLPIKWLESQLCHNISVAYALNEFYTYCTLMATVHIKTIKYTCHTNGVFYMTESGANHLIDSGISLLVINSCSSYIWIQCSITLLPLHVVSYH